MIASKVKEIRLSLDFWEASDLLHFLMFPEDTISDEEMLHFRTQLIDDISALVKDELD